MQPSKFSKSHQKRFGYFVACWAVGAIVASQLCELVGSINIPLIDQIPSVKSYALATKHSCQAHNIWMYGWLVFPACLVFLVAEGNRNVDFHTDTQGKLLSLVLFAAATYMCVFGIYEPYPGESNGKIAYQFRENEFGAIVLSIAIWSFFWSMVMVNYQWMKGIFR